MCDPITLAVVAVVATTASVIGEVQSANAQTKALVHANEVKAKEIDQSATAEINDRNRAARREAGRTRVAAGEAGLNLGSGSVEALLLDSSIQAGQANSRSLANRESRQNASDAETESALSRVTKPTVLGAGIQIASAGIKGYAAGGGKISR